MEQKQKIELGIYKNKTGSLYEVTKIFVYGEGIGVCYNSLFGDFDCGIQNLLQFKRNYTCVIKKDLYNNITKLSELQIKAIHKLTSKMINDNIVIERKKLTKKIFPQFVKNIKLKPEDEKYVLDNINYNVIDVVTSTDIYQETPWRDFNTPIGSVSTIMDNNSGEDPMTENCVDEYNYWKGIQKYIDEFKSKKRT